MTKNNTQWYASWFDTPYYHILYQDRNFEEAEAFMTQLTHFLKLPQRAEIMDLACGKGRHSVTLYNLGFKVTGVDLSKNSIKHAKKFENENLKFEVHDMTQIYPKQFDAVFNLFTSFGYFETEDCNYKTINAIKQQLKPNGYAVIDFLNVNFLKKNMIKQDIKTVQGIDFHQKRKIEEGYIFKDIKFNHKGSEYVFQERVQALTLQDFIALFKQAQVELLHVFGNYDLQDYDAQTSPRLIMIFR